MIFKTNNETETIDLGIKIGKLVTPGMVITLKGDLGAGKTTFTKGIGLGLDIKRPVNSPTFTIMKIYQGRMPLYHLDAYRLEDLHQDLGFEEYIESDGLCVIEWADFISELLPKEALSISITYDDDFKRTFEITSNGSKYNEILEAI